MSDTVERPIVETPGVAELHTKAVELLHAAIEAVKEFLGHPDVVDDTAMHTAAKQADYDLGGALKTLANYNVTQGVVAADPPEEPEATPPIAERPIGPGWRPDPQPEPEPEPEPKVEA